jgi:hypothetical protein
MANTSNVVCHMEGVRLQAVASSTVSLVTHDPSNLLSGFDFRATDVEVNGTILGTGWYNVNSTTINRRVFLAEISFAAALNTTWYVADSTIAVTILDGVVNASFTNVTQSNCYAMVIQLAGAMRHGAVAARNVTLRAVMSGGTVLGSTLGQYVNAIVSAINSAPLGWDDVSVSVTDSAVASSVDFALIAADLLPFRFPLMMSATAIVTVSVPTSASLIAVSRCRVSANVSLAPDIASTPALLLMVWLPLVALVLLSNPSPCGLLKPVLSVCPSSFGLSESPVPVRNTTVVISSSAVSATSFQVPDYGALGLYASMSINASALNVTIANCTLRTTFAGSGVLFFASILADSSVALIDSSVVARRLVDLGMTVVRSSAASVLRCVASTFDFPPAYAAIAAAYYTGPCPLVMAYAAGSAMAWAVNGSAFTNYTSFFDPATPWAPDAAQDAVLLGCNGWAPPADPSRASPLGIAALGAPRVFVTYPAGSATLGGGRTLRCPGYIPTPSASNTASAEATATAVDHAVSLSAAVRLLQNMAIAQVPIGAVASVAASSATDLQLLAVLSTMPCAPPEVQHAAGPSMYLVSPFYGAGWAAVAGGNMALSVGVVVLHASVGAGAWASGWVRSLRAGMTLVQFPGWSFTVVAVLFQGVCQGSFALLSGGSGAELFLGSIGVVYAAALLGVLQYVTSWCLSALRFWRYDFAQSHTVPLLWLLPEGRWGPPRQRGTVGKLVVTVNGAHKGFAPLPLFLAALVSLIGSFHATGPSCVAVLSLLSLVFAVVAVAYAYFRPMRVPLWSFTVASSASVLSLIALIGALAVGGAVGRSGAVAATAALSMVLTLLSVANAVHRACVMVLEMFVWTDQTAAKQELCRKCSWDHLSKEHCYAAYDAAPSLSRELHIFRGLDDRYQRLELLIVAITNSTRKV